MSKKRRAGYTAKGKRQGFKPVMVRHTQSPDPLAHRRAKSLGAKAQRNRVAGTRELFLGFIIRCLVRKDGAAICDVVDTPFPVFCVGGELPSTLGTRAFSNWTHMTRGRDPKTLSATTSPNIYDYEKVVDDETVPAYHALAPSATNGAWNTATNLLVFASDNQVDIHPLQLVRAGAGLCGLRLRSNRPASANPDGTFPSYQLCPKPYWEISIILDTSDFKTPAQLSEPDPNPDPDVFVVNWGDSPSLWQGWFLGLPFIDDDYYKVQTELPENFVGFFGPPSCLDADIEITEGGYTATVNFSVELRKQRKTLRFQQGCQNDVNGEKGFAHVTVVIVRDSDGVNATVVPSSVTSWRDVTSGLSEEVKKELYPYPSVSLPMWRYNLGPKYPLYFLNDQEIAAYKAGNPVFFGSDPGYFYYGGSYLNRRIAEEYLPYQWGDIPYDPTENWFTYEVASLNRSAIQDILLTVFQSAGDGEVMIPGYGYYQVRELPEPVFDPDTGNRVARVAYAEYESLGSIGGAEEAWRITHTAKREECVPDEEQGEVCSVSTVTSVTIPCIVRCIRAYDEDVFNNSFEVLQTASTRIANTHVSFRIFVSTCDIHYELSRHEVPQRKTTGSYTETVGVLVSDGSGFEIIEKHKHTSRPNPNIANPDGIRYRDVEDMPYRIEGHAKIGDNFYVLVQTETRAYTNQNFSFQYAVEGASRSAGLRLYVYSAGLWSFYDLGGYSELFDCVGATFDFSTFHVDRSSTSARLQKIDIKYYPNWDPAGTIPYRGIPRTLGEVLNFALFIDWDEYAVDQAYWGFPSQGYSPPKQIPEIEAGVLGFVDASGRLITINVRNGAPELSVRGTITTASVSNRRSYLNVLSPERRVYQNQTDTEGEQTAPAVLSFTYTYPDSIGDIETGAFDPAVAPPGEETLVSKDGGYTWELLNSSGGRQGLFTLPAKYNPWFYRGEE